MKPGPFLEKLCRTTKEIDEGMCGITVVPPTGRETLLELQNENGFLNVCHEAYLDKEKHQHGSQSSPSALATAGVIPSNLRTKLDPAGQVTNCRTTVRLQPACENGTVFLEPEL